METKDELFPTKLARVGLSAVGGIKAPDKENFQAIVDHGYVSPRAFENPPLELMEMEIASQLEAILERHPATDFTKIPWSTSRFSKGKYLQVMVGFADQHKQPIDEQVFPPQKARQYVNGVMALSRKLKRQITIPEQLEVALELADNSILGAVVIAHAGSRAIAKVSDTRLSKELNFTDKEVAEWKDCVSTFRSLTGEYGSPPADTYHFWGTLLAGIVSTIRVTKKDLLLNPGYRFLYSNMGKFVELLRYKVSKQGDGTMHQEIDGLGYHLGSFLADYLQVDKKEASRASLK